MMMVPLVTGAAIGILAAGHVIPVLLLTVVVLILFWLRTPVESWFGSGAIRAQTPEERRLVRNIVLPLAAVAAGSLGLLLWHGANLLLIWIGLVAAVAFAAQMILKKLGRATRMAAEIVGALALTSTAPAAYYVATGRLDITAWMLWLLNWWFAANQVHFVWLTIRGSRAAGWAEKFAAGRSFLLAQVLLGGTVALGGWLHFVPRWTVLAFAPVLFRGFAWFARKPQPLVVRRLGWTELIQAIVFGLLLIGAFGSAL
jgi:hypothetical protein